MPKKDVNGQIQQVEAAGDPQQQPAPEEAPAPQEAADARPEAPAAEAAQRLAEELEQTREQLLRHVAEFQNYRRRVDRERATLLQRGRTEVIEPMLNVLDDFRRSLEASAQVEQQDEPGPAYQALKEGVELVYRNLSDVLTKLGVEYIEAVGKPFDEHEHEAMMQLPAPEGTEPGTVLEELQRGYRLGDRILRHARVVVAA